MSGPPAAPAASPAPNGPVVPFGERAFRFAIPSAADRRALLAALRALPGVVDVVLAEAHGAAVLAAPPSLPAAATAAVAAVASVLAAAAASAPAHGSASTPASAPTEHAIPVVYDGDDLPELADRLGVTSDDIVTMHTAPAYEVAMLGFMPGFAYLRGLDPRLVLARRAQPRTRVPAGSVAIAAEYTGIYPHASPGGWHLLGHALRPMFGPNGALFAVGDRVRFQRATGDAVGVARVSSAGAAARAAPLPRSGPRLEVVRAQGPAFVIDGGRPGHMHEGVPHGGPMVPEALAFANASAGNDPDEAGIEVYGSFEVVARGGSVVVADDVRGVRVLAEGEALAVATEGRARVRYLAVGGGIDVPVVVGGRGTMIGARLGGFEGRGLRRGDELGVAGAGAGAGTGTGAERIGHGHGHGHGHVGRSAGVDGDEDESAGVRIEVVGGPDGDERVARAVEAAVFRIGAASDRVGTRLEGPELPAHSMQYAHDRRSAPMVEGAIEVTPSGLVVLGPDHPTTGGYPVLGVVRPHALGRLFRLRVGAALKLVISPAKPT